MINKILLVQSENTTDTTHTFFISLGGMSLTLHTALKTLCVAEFLQNKLNHEVHYNVFVLIQFILN